MSATLAACETGPGDCTDEAGAFEIVYQPDGTPAFAGQAMMIESCGGGGFCHSQGIARKDRFGAPQGLDFDLTLASTTPDAENERLARLAAHQEIVLNNRDGIWAQVTSGAMPPDGAVGNQILQSTDLGFERVAQDGTTFSPLPEVRSDEGREILRNWLACRAPVVERSAPRQDLVEVRIGFLVDACARRCVDPTWPDIYAKIIEPSCATAACHDSTNPSANLNLMADDPTSAASVAGVVARLSGQGPSGGLCSSSGSWLTPGMASQSLLFTKCDANPTCGSRMPLAGSVLTEGSLCALREWIDCGACAAADDPACATCLEQARTTCGIDVNQPSLCTTAPSCERLFPVPPV